MLDYVNWIVGEMRADQDGDVSMDWSSGLDHPLRVIVSTIWPGLSHMAGGQDRLRAHTLPGACTWSGPSRPCWRTSMPKALKRVVS